MMAFPSWNTPDVIIADLAAVLKQFGTSPTVVAPSGQFWQQIVGLQLQSATDRIYMSLIQRGYTVAPTNQIAAWDAAPSMERQIALYLSLVAGGMLEQVSDTLLKVYESYTDPEKGILANSLITVGGVGQDPLGKYGQAFGGQPSWDGGWKCGGSDIFNPNPHEIHF